MPNCTAVSSRTGKPCGRSAIVGGNVCIMHGGSAPQVRAAANARLLQMVNPALGVLARATRARQGRKNWEPTAQEITAARYILDRAGVGQGTMPGEILDPTDVGGQGTFEEFMRVYRKKEIRTGDEQ